jgi:16S rRNA (cytosine1402-N4)-methyltransferase
MSATNEPSVPRHRSVLVTEVLAAIQPSPGQIIVDATLGAGGHARQILARLGNHGRLIALDRDAEMLELARPWLDLTRTTLVQANFDRLREVLDELRIPEVDGVLADLGICSDQLEAAERGLSFQQKGRLDMRLDRSGGPTAADLLRRLDERELADVFFRFGEERFSRRIARRVVEERRRAPFETTTQFADLVRRCVPRSSRRSGIDPATRCFQALRIAVNDELGALERLLRDLPRCLKPGGVAALISFHSLEDRLVKQAFRDRNRWLALTRKPVTAGDDERRTNPRSRSAKLRAACLIEIDGTGKEHGR